MEFKKFQISLAEFSQKTYERLGAPLSKTVLEAYDHHPRHLFVPRFRKSGDNRWIELTEENSQKVLPEIYKDHPLILWGSEEDFDSNSAQVSTISQPSFVLRMLDLLQIKKGHAVFELGTASGWNAALISYLTGESGKVVTAEIISTLADSAEKRFQKMGLKNIRVFSGDAARYEGSEIFDRVMYTAGAHDFPKNLFDRLHQDALVLFVFKARGGSDYLYLMKLNDGVLESIYSQSCSFVPVTGSTHMEEMHEKNLEEFLKRKNIPGQGESRRFHWGVTNNSHFFRQTSPLRSFLALHENYESFSETFGWLEGNSLCLAKPDEMVSYGGSRASESLQKKIEEWVDLGMPTLSNMKFRIYPLSKPRKATKDRRWLSPRKESMFEWGLS